MCEHEVTEKKDPTTIKRGDRFRYGGWTYTARHDAAGIYNVTVQVFSEALNGVTDIYIKDGEHVVPLEKEGTR